MNKIVAIVAPRGPLGFFLKTLAVLLLIGVVNYVRDQIEHGVDADSLVNNVIEASFVALPFSVFGLALIHHMKRLQDQLVEMATTDLLTGLPNRRAFLGAVQAHLPKPGGVLMMIDVDHFKQVNDTYGHAVGDLCLQVMAQYLRDLLKPGDLFARLGGEEFAVMLPGADQHRAALVGEAISNGVQLPLASGEGGRTVTSSVGAVWSSESSDISVLLRLADKALYRAKSDGRGRMVMHEQTDAHGIEPHAALA